MYIVHVHVVDEGTVIDRGYCTLPIIRGME